MTKLYRGMQRHGARPSLFGRGPAPSAEDPRVWPAAFTGGGELKMVGKEQDGSCKLTPQGQRDMDRIAGQVATANQNH